MEPLRVEAIMQTNPNRRSLPAAVNVRLTNQQSEPVLINKRLAVGYRNDFHRELFAEVFPRGGSEVISKEARDYQRDPSPATDYVWLPPGESVSTSFDLFRWYRLPGPGEYELVVSYQAGASSNGYPESLLPGIHSSARISFEVID